MYIDKMMIEIVNSKYLQSSLTFLTKKRLNRLIPNAKTQIIKIDASIIQ